MVLASTVNATGVIECLLQADIVNADTIAGTDDAYVDWIAYVSCSGPEPMTVLQLTAELQACDVPVRPTGAIPTCEPFASGGDLQAASYFASDSGTPRCSGCAPGLVELGVDYDLIYPPTYLPVALGACRIASPSALECSLFDGSVVPESS